MKESKEKVRTNKLEANMFRNRITYLSLSFQFKKSATKGTNQSANRSKRINPERLIRNLTTKWEEGRGGEEKKRTRKKSPLTKSVSRGNRPTKTLLTHRRTPSRVLHWSGLRIIRGHPGRSGVRGNDEFPRRPNQGYPNGDVLHGGCNYHVVIANRCYRGVGVRRTDKG